MTFESLADFLDPQDHSKTIEGPPCPGQSSIFSRSAFLKVTQTTLGKCRSRFTALKN